uniref:Uncharacterized protein n=1 Tax=Globisporangium ultimum (strain ATCC 200006 / CBS 805.95 / DAOM BR144) TaxID=431595 RepID=K3X0W5_GLOUD
MALSKPMEMLAAATAAGVGGFVATSVLYPLDTLKTRMQSGSKALLGDDKDGSARDYSALVKSLYQGIQYKTAESSVSKFLYFYAYTMLAQVVAPKDGKPIGTATNLFIGYVSEFTHLPVTLPMEVIATRLQTASKGSGGILQIVRSVLEESGVKGFYKGFQAYFVLCLQPAIQYTVFERVKEMYLRRFKQAAQSLGALEAFVLGAIARSIATLLLFPYIRAKVIVQSKKKLAAKTPGDLEQQPSADGIVATLQRVYKEEGALSLYRGLGPELTKGALSSAFMLMIKEKIQAYITLLLILASATK